ncbi:Arginyl-tRNA--protein transferase 1 [Tulasnella sp. 424]|nr:Arginyl-tRNA--protein transferase 1 [Tulasnella sp. 424]KAG8977612.1 Arginyl-tRNA--protein transferase 1 [Tulasnella sp. 425]
MISDPDDEHVVVNNEEEEEPFSLAQPYGSRASTCGYCGPPGARSVTRSSYTFGLDAVQLSCMFKPSRSQRKVLYRFNRFVLGDGEAVAGEDRDDGGADNAGGQPAGGSSSSKKTKGGGKQKSKNKNKGKDFTPAREAAAAAAATSSVPSAKTGPSFPLVDELHSAEYAFLQDEEKEKVVHRYEVTLEPSSFTEEKFQLYCSYQKAIHKDDDKSRQSFKRFLCDTPLKRQKIPYAKQPPAHLPAAYGSHHQMYRVDGELVAMGVIDILPFCVSSVYLMYSPKWEAHSLGKLSALKEIALAQEIFSYGAPGMGYLYMGFYIHTCPKMKYKGQYAPSFLLDPEEYTWHPTEKAFPLLDKYLYVPFSNPTSASRPTPGNRSGQSGGSDSNAEPIDEDDDDMSDNEEDASAPSQPQLSSETLAAVQVGQISGGTIYTVPAQSSRHWTNSYSRGLITLAATLLGEEAAPKVILLSP